MSCSSLCFRRREGARGFSLIELLIVIAIILVILAVAVPKLGSAKMNANEMVVMREIQTIKRRRSTCRSLADSPPHSPNLDRPPAAARGRKPRI